MVQAIRARKRLYSEEEKRRFCEAYIESGLSRELYCREAGISKSALGKWRKKFKPQVDENFFEVSPWGQHRLNCHQLMDVRIRLPNQLELLVSIKEGGLVPFIREICDATSTLR